MTSGLHLHAKTRAGGQHVPGADAHVEVVGRQDPQVLFREASLRRTWRSVCTQPLLNADSSHNFVSPKTLDCMASTTSSEVEIYGRTPRGDLKPSTIVLKSVVVIHLMTMYTFICLPNELTEVGNFCGLGFCLFSIIFT